MRVLHALPLLGLTAAAALAGVLLPGPSDAARAGTPAARQPVVVELFSSEGCSSCPSADAVLARLARDQPVPGAEVIALELHVDYWNYLGWTDPFSSAAFSARQQGYAEALGQRGVYTPQMVVDGAAELIGSNEPGARAAVAAAAREPRTRVVVTRSGDKVSIAIPEPSEKGDADVWLAVTEEGLSTAVPRGENRGATLAHGPVVRALTRVTTLAAGSQAAVTKDVDVTVKPGWRREGLRAVAFVQRRGSMRISGAGTVSLR